MTVQAAVDTIVCSMHTVHCIFGGGPAYAAEDSLPASTYAWMRNHVGQWHSKDRTAACKPSITQSALKDAQASCQDNTQHAAASQTVGHVQPTQ